MSVFALHDLGRKQWLIPRLVKEQRAQRAWHRTWHSYMGLEKQVIQGQIGASRDLTRAENREKLVGKWLTTEMTRVFPQTQGEARKGLDVLSAPALVLH